MSEILSPAQVAETNPKFKKGQVVMLASGKQMPFIILDVMLDDGVWFYAWNRNNYAMEAMIRAITPEEAGLCDSYDAQAAEIERLKADASRERLMWRNAIQTVTSNPEDIRLIGLSESNDVRQAMSPIIALSDEVARLKAKLADALESLNTLDASDHADCEENRDSCKACGWEYDDHPAMLGETLVCEEFKMRECTCGLKSAIAELTEDAAMQPAEQAKEQG